MISELMRTRFGAMIVDAALAIRAVPFVGRRYECPCCRWRLRTFTKGGSSLRARHHGFCPRCNSKARHRRDWLYLEERTDLFTQRRRLLHISPRFALSRRLSRAADIDYVGLDIEQRPHLDVQANVSSMPLGGGSFDAVICIHVLEHVDDDRSAMQELYRVLKPGGWALITVPVMLDQPTFEDPTITTPEARESAFGERSHVRYYGYDVVDRLEACGFVVTMDRGDEIDSQAMERYGLLPDETILHCAKPLSRDSSD